MSAGDGPRVEAEVRGGGVGQWTQASWSSPPSNVSGAGKRAAEGGV